MSYTKEECAEYAAKYGCYCGGDGVYTDYNCGASYELTCPHCRGTGKKDCPCEVVSLKCDRYKR